MLLLSKKKKRKNNVKLIKRTNIPQYKKRDGKKYITKG